MQIPILHRRFLRCRGCALRFIPERGATPAACPACGSKDLRRRFEPAHLGVLLLLAGVGTAAMDRSWLPAARAPARETARIEARRLEVPVEAGPLRGRNLTLRRGDVVEVKEREGAVLLVEDAKGNQVRVKAKHVALR